MLTQYDLVKRRQVRNEFTMTFPVTTGSAYSTGNILGTVVEIGNSNGVNGPFEEEWLSCMIQSLVVLDPDAQNKDMDLYFFNQKPTAPYTDKTAFAPSLADLKNCVGIVHVASGDYVTSGSSGSIAGGANQANIGRNFKPFGAGNKSIYCVAVTRGNPTFTEGHVYVKLQFKL